jgi:PBSX family phage portal protein
VDDLPLPSKSSIKRKGARLQKRAEEKIGTKSVAPEQWINAYDVMQVVQPPHDLDILAKLYESNGAHNAACTMKAINIAGLGYEWVETPRLKFELEQLEAKNEKAYQARMIKLKEEKLDLDDLLDSMNTDEEFNELMINIWIDIEAMGNGYLEVGRNLKGDIKYIGHIPAQTMRVRSPRDGFIQLVSNKMIFFHNFGVYNGDGDKPSNPLGDSVSVGGDPHPNEVIQFKKYSPDSSYYGVPDIIAALPAAVGDKFAREYNLDYFENKAVPRYAFILKGAKLSQTAETNLVNYFRNELKGKHHGTLYIPLPATFNQNVEAEFKALENGIQDLSFINYIKENRQEILMVHRVPPSKVGVTGSSNLATARDADKTFKAQVCAPEQRRLEKKIDRIFKEWTNNFFLKFIEADIIDADIQSRIHDRYLRTQVLVPNDVLNDLGRPTRPDGNEPLPYVKGANDGGPGQKTSDGAKPSRASNIKDTGQRQERGQAQDGGRAPENPNTTRK